MLLLTKANLRIFTLKATFLSCSFLLKTSLNLSCTRGHGQLCHVASTVVRLAGHLGIFLSTERLVEHDGTVFLVVGLSVIHNFQRIWQEELFSSMNP